tara:strand:+ start:310 stop:792 length:483 start_codon:yes stop_codon:yes gene_type:complete
MKQHTAKTLKYYSGMEVYIHCGSYCSHTRKGILASISIHDQSDVVFSNDGVLSCYNRSLYPILKTANELTEEILNKVYCDEQDDTDLDIDQWFNMEFFGEDGGEYYSKPGPKELQRLLELGYGAIENKESPTGYVDLFGMPCVTPEQVEAGVIIEAKDWG